ncbi:MAG: hypothetical protein CFE37_07925 [Alphaproteobacteria bacterium PA4]|nr:MAG: hypothetical protein CFE37_07925 [Alphaproteobacteria bacterium PA4]
MAWDLARALHRKAEVESARLQDFAFQQRARAIGLIAKAHGRDPADLAGELAVCPDAELIERLSDITGQDPAATESALSAALATARQQLLAELGDPSPHRLA